MHHVYPRECSQPVGHKSEGTLAAKDWLRIYGPSSLEATSEQMLVHVSKFEKQSSEDVFMPWTAEEELVAENYQPSARQAWSLVSFRTGAALMLVVSFAGSLVARSRSLSQGHRKVESVMV